MPNYCIDCGKEVTKKSIRCLSCFHKTRRGIPKSSETRKKISESLKGRSTGPLSDETKAKISKALKGYKHSEKTKRTYSEAAIKREQERIKRSIQTNVEIGRYLPIGATRIDNKGYVVEKIAHGKGNRNWRVQHRVVMERHLQRELNKTEIVHHIDGNKTNNDIDNLALLTPEEHGILNRVIRIIENKNKDYASIVIKTITHRYEL